MKLTIDQALERYGRSCGPANKPKVLAALRRYLEWGGQATDENLAAYLQHLQAQGYKPATVDLRRRQIRAFWRALGAPPPRAVLDFHPAQDSDRPALDLALVRQLLAAQDQYPAYTRALLTLSTLYGPRAIEMSRVKPADMDLANGRWYIRTAKGGPPRWLWVPPEARKALDVRWPTVSVAHVEKRFEEVWLLAGLEDRPPRVGWHAIRRTLTHELGVNGVPEDAIEQFMRWAGGGAGSHAMVKLYKNPNQTVGAAGIEATAQELAGTRAEDAAVWEKHPIVRGFPSP